MFRLSERNRTTKIRLAFTLVELLIVIGIITILAAVTLPSVKSLLHGQKVTQAARMVQAHIESARARAIASGTFVAVILERSSNETNTVLSLSIGSVFPPYSGDTLGAGGVLDDAVAFNTSTSRFTAGRDEFYDRLTVGAVDGGLIHPPVSAFGSGDFIQVGDRQNLFVIKDVSSAGVIDFYNPPFHTHVDGTEWAIREKQLPVLPSDTPLLSTDNPIVGFRIFRKPTKSFIQPTKLPRGTCLDLSVSGKFQLSGTVETTEYADLSAPLMIVFDERGSVVFVNTGATFGPPSGIIQLLVGRVEQVAVAGSRQALADPNDRGSSTANLNDAENLWVSINPRTGAVYTSPMQVGSESATFSARLAVARAFATNNIVRTVE